MDNKDFLRNEKDIKNVIRNQKVSDFLKKDENKEKYVLREFAKDIDNGLFISANISHKNDNLQCPQCNKTVITCNINSLRYFKHKEATECLNYLSEIKG